MSRDRKGRPTSERQRAASRRNGRLGGRTKKSTETQGLRELRRITREESLTASRDAMRFLRRLMDDELTDKDGNPVSVAIEVRERAAGRLLAKLPDELFVSGLEDALPRLVTLTHYRDAKGELHEAEQEIPGPETVQ